MIRGPCHFNRVERVTFLGESEIVGGIGLGIGIVERTFGDFGRAFTIILPGFRGVYGVAIRLELGADFAQDLLRCPNPVCTSPAERSVPLSFEPHLTPEHPEQEEEVSQAQDHAGYPPHQPHA